MNPSAEFVSALEEERSTARSKLRVASTESDRFEALGRLADLDELAQRTLDGVDRGRSLSLPSAHAERLSPQGRPGR